MEEELEELLNDTYEEDFYQKPINFTPEERARIDRLLAEGEEYQRQHGNKRYTMEELRGRMRELYNSYLQNWDRYSCIFGLRWYI